MSSAAWWAARLNGQAPPPQPQAYVPVQQQQVPQYPTVQQHPAFQPQAPVAIDQQQLAMLVKSGQMNFHDGVVHAISTWQGNKKDGAARFDRDNCPECGSVRFFHRTGKSLMTSGGVRVPPAPQCADCGYNGMYEQYGSRDEVPTLQE